MGEFPQRVLIASYYEDEVVVRQLRSSDYAMRSAYATTKLMSSIQENINNDVDDNRTLIAGILYISMIPEPDYISDSKMIIELSKHQTRGIYCRPIKTNDT